MIDAAVNTSIVVGLICLKFAFDAFEERRAELKASFCDLNHDYNHGHDAVDSIADELDARAYFLSASAGAAGLRRSRFFRTVG